MSIIQYIIIDKLLAFGSGSSYNCLIILAVAIPHPTEFTLFVSGYALLGGAGMVGVAWALRG